MTVVGNGHATDDWMNTLGSDRLSPGRLRVPAMDDSLVTSVLVDRVKDGGPELLAAPAYLL
jgi:hypothetical protein